MARSSSFLSASLANGRLVLADGVGVRLGRLETSSWKQSGVQPKSSVFPSSRRFASCTPGTPVRRYVPTRSACWRNATGSAGHLADRSGVITAFP